MSIVQFPVKDKTSADTCTDGQSDKVVVVFSFPEVMLTQGKAVSVVVDKSWSVELVLKNLSEMYFFPRRDVGNIVDDPSFAVHDRGNAYAN